MTYRFEHVLRRTMRERTLVAIRVVMATPDWPEANTGGQAFQPNVCATATYRCSDNSHDMITRRFVVYSTKRFAV